MTTLLSWLNTNLVSGIYWGCDTAANVDRLAAVSLQGVPFVGIHEPWAVFQHDQTLPNN
jgi:hypothetical protein